jgi:hypothetical protein
MLRYGEGMSDVENPSGGLDSEELALRDALLQGDATLASIAPILRHLLANEDGAMFGEEIVARVRGTIADVARQLLDRIAAAGGELERGVHDADDMAAMTAAIVGDPAFLNHVHALAIEWQLVARLHTRLTADPVLSPLLQALMARPDPETAALAMHLLAAQARWCQMQRRMELPLGELPGDLLHRALIAMRTVAGAEAEADRRAAKAEAEIRGDYDESGSRLGMLSRLVTGMGAGADAALSFSHAGVAIFITALGIASAQDRDLVALSTSEAQQARFMLSLRAAGLMPDAIDEQFLTLHPDTVPLKGIGKLGADRAAAMLALAGGSTGILA